MSNPAVKGILCPRVYRWSWRWPFRRAYAGPAFAIHFDPPNPFPAHAIIRNTETGENMLVDSAQPAEGTSYTAISRRGMGSIGTMPINYCDEFMLVAHWDLVADRAVTETVTGPMRLRAV